jgi:hypothetical protein
MREKRKKKEEDKVSVEPTTNVRRMSTVPPVTRPRAASLSSSVHVTFEKEHTGVYEDPRAREIVQLLQHVYIM